MTVRFVTARVFRSFIKFEREVKRSIMRSATPYLAVTDVLHRVLVDAVMFAKFEGLRKASPLCCATWLTLSLGPPSRVRMINILSLFRMKSATVASRLKSQYMSHASNPASRRLNDFIPRCNRRADEYASVVD